MAAQFTGRNGGLLLFTDEGRGVVVESEFGVVVARGRADILQNSAAWTPGEFSEADMKTAESAFSTMDSVVSQPTGRMYTIPKGVQSEAKKAYDWMNRYGRGGTDVSVHTAGILASGGQIPFEKLRHVSGYLSRHSNDKFSDAWEPSKDGSPSAARITWGMWGGDTARKWTESILSREGDKALTADAVYESDEPTDPFTDAFELDPDIGPEFLARVRLDGSGIDRLYKIDIDGAVYVWDDGVWDNLGFVEGDIYSYDAALDMDLNEGDNDPVGKSHVVIDPSSAVIIGARLQQDPFTPVSIDDIDADEADMVREAIGDQDWDMIDQALVAAPVGNYNEADPENGAGARSQRASTQLRDANGRFATEGERVSVGGSGQKGVITQVNTSNQTVDVQLDQGGSVTVAAKSISSADSISPEAIKPGNPVAVPRLDLRGILGEPRTPINAPYAQIPGTLPALTSKDLHKVLSNWPAYVTDMRLGYKDIPARSAIATNEQNTVGRPASLAEMEKKSGVSLITDAYKHPLLSSWLRQQNAQQTHSNSVWYMPVYSTDGATFALGDPGAPETPDNADVQPIYMAVVAPDDPTAVTQLIALVPAGTNSTSPMVYNRKDGTWERDARTLQDLQSATPPPVVPLDGQAYADCIAQVDSTQEDEQIASSQEEEPIATEIEGSTVTQTNASPGRPVGSGPNQQSGAAPVPSVPTQNATTASAGMSNDEAFLLLWGPRQNIVAAALTAAGGVDRNNGGADKLRHYWTHGAGAAKIRWGTPGDWTRCYRHLAKFMGTRAKGYCALRHKETTGMWTGDKKNLSSIFEESFSNHDIVGEDEYINRIFAKARATFARQRVKGLTASGMETENGPVYGELPDKPGGSAFIIPLLLPIGVESGDGRMIAEDAEVAIRDLPIPLLWQINTATGHDGSVVVGRIDSMEITPTGVRNAVGVLDNGEYGAEVERLIRGGFIKGVSADMDQFEAQEIPVFAENDGDDDTPAKIAKQQILVNKTRIMAATVVAKPAFQEVQIILTSPDSEQDNAMLYNLEDGYYSEELDPIEAAAMVAAGSVARHIPVEPPKGWFDNPNLHAPTPITVTDDGRVFGHIASWDQDHIGMAGNTKPPRSRSNYAYFQAGVLRTAEGVDVNVGQLTLTGGHADLTFSARETVKHYDDTASAIADVKAGEDNFGIWVSGALRPGVTPEQIRAFRASKPSGDWRPIKGKLELVAVCQVNVPGFPVARTLVAGGQQMALVAAGAATLARMQSDPVAEMQARLEKLEQFSAAELSAKADPIREKFAAIKKDTEDKRKAELAAKAEELASRIDSASTFGYVSPAKRKKAASDGHALKDGSFPINTEDDLNKAIKAVGRAKNPGAAKAHIKKRARALGKADLIPDTWSVQGIDLHARVAEFATKTAAEKRQQDDAIEKIAREVNPTGAGTEEDKTSSGTETPATTGKSGDDDPKYTPETQPRDDDGKFRLILARLRDNVGVNGNEEILQKLQAIEGIRTGDYKAASLAYADLSNTLTRIDTGAMPPGTRGTLRRASNDLANAVANLPLPFDDQAQKVRFSDLPPVLREMIQNLVTQVEAKYSDKAPEKLEDINLFMAGGDYYSQSNVSTQLNHLMHLLTVNNKK